MLEMHYLLKIQCHQDGNFNLQTSRTEEAVRKESKDRSVKYVHQEIEPCLELFLVFQDQGRYQLTGQIHLMCQQY